MDKKDISTEEYRIYHFDNGTSFRIDNPRDLYISSSGSHRVVTKEDMTYWVCNKFISIQWYAPTEPVSF